MHSFEPNRKIESKDMYKCLLGYQLEMAIGRVGLGWANSGPDQNQTGPKLTRFFLGQNFNSPVGPKNWAGRVK